jgi:hypothetical protein
VPSIGRVTFGVDDKCPSIRSLFFKLFAVDPDVRFPNKTHRIRIIRVVLLEALFRLPKHIAQPQKNAFSEEHFSFVRLGRRTLFRHWSRLDIDMQLHAEEVSEFLWQHDTPTVFGLLESLQ